MKSKVIHMGEFQVTGTKSVLTASQAVMKHLLSKDAKFIRATYEINGKKVSIERKS